MRYPEIDPGFFVRNRQKLVSLLPDNAAVLVVSNDEMPDSGDETHPFHQNPDLFHLTGIDQEQTLLLLCPNHSNPECREQLFIVRTNPTIEIWNGYKYTTEHAARVSGIRNVRWRDDFEPALKEVMAEAGTLYMGLDEDWKCSFEVEKQTQRFCRKIQQQFPLHQLGRLAPVMRELRLRKEPVEIDLIRKAVGITARAFDRVLHSIRPGMAEYEAEAEITYEFIRCGASGHAFSPIAASGKDTCVLHYIKNDKICKDGDLLLLDFGCRYANYHSDISRTIPVNGHFTPRQRQVYEACHRIYTEAKRHYLPGMTINKLNRILHQLMEKELIGLGLFTAEDVAANNGDALPLIRKYYMHNIGHFLGLDTHDVGNREVVFEPGMIVSCEPGIYIADEGIGVRIETDMLVADSPIDLGAEIPSGADEIEKIINSK